jgi:RHS repeat-associated protein
VVYLPFGEALIDSHANPDVMPYKFNGKEKDEETGLYYYGARYYNGDDQVWMGVDPLWEEYPGVSPYVYCLNNPVKLVDPDGESPTLITGAIGAVVGGVIGGAIEAGSQYIQHGEIKDWKAVGGASLQGAVAGGMIGLTGGASLAGTVVAGGLGNAAGGIANDMVQGKESTISSIASDAATGSAMVIGGAVAGKAIGKGIGVLEKSLSKTSSVTTNSGSNFTKTLAEQGKDLVKLNGGKNSVTIGTPTKQIRYDLAGKDHGGVPTPHTQIYNKNIVDGQVRSISRASKEAIPMTQQDIRIVRKYLEKSD